MGTRVKMKTRRSSEQAAPSALRDGVRAFKREIILQTAIDAFYNRGYQNVTVDDVAGALSVTKAVVYYNFDTKEKILEAIIDRTTERSRESIDRGIESGNTPAQKLAVACFLYANHTMKDQKMIGVYFREDRCFPPSLRARTTQAEKSMTAKLSKVIDTGISGGEFRACDARAVAITIMGMISMAFYWYREGGRLSREKLCQHFANQALRLVGYEGEIALDEGIVKLPTGATGQK
jgi:AcrR family transcriptional regulator